MATHPYHVVSIDGSGSYDEDTLTHLRPALSPLIRHAGLAILASEASLVIYLIYGENHRLICGHNYIFVCGHYHRHVCATIHLFKGFLFGFCLN
jgi:hypothetical protein